MSERGIEINGLIQEISALELRALMDNDSPAEIIHTYKRKTETLKDEFRAIYRVNNILYDSIHMFSVKVSEIEEKGFNYQILEPNNYWGKEKTIFESFESAIKKASTVNDSKQVMEAVMVIWNTIADDYVLLRKDYLGIQNTQPESNEESTEDHNLINWYKKGWHRLWSGGKYSKTEIVSKNDLENKAFHFGATEFIAGDDVSVLDLKSNKEILDVIRRQ